MKTNKMIVLAGVLGVLAVVLVPTQINTAEAAPKTSFLSSAKSKISNVTSHDAAKAATGLSAFTGIALTFIDMATDDPKKKKSLQQARDTALGIAGATGAAQEAGQGGYAALLSGALGGTQALGSTIAQQQEALRLTQQQEALRKAQHEAALAAIRYGAQPAVQQSIGAMSALQDVAGEAARHAQEVEQQLKIAQLELQKTAAQQISDIRDIAALATTTANKSVVNDAAQQQVAQVNEERAQMQAELAAARKEAEEAKSAALELQRRAEAAEDARRAQAEAAAKLEEEKTQQAAELARIAKADAEEKADAAEKLENDKKIEAHESAMRELRADLSKKTAVADTKQNDVTTAALNLAEQTKDVQEAVVEVVATVTFATDAKKWTALTAAELKTPTPKAPAKPAVTAKVLKLLGITDPSTATKTNITPALKAATDYWKSNKAVTAKISLVKTYLASVLPTAAKKDVSKKEPRFVQVKNKDGTISYVQVND